MKGQTYIILFILFTIIVSVFAVLNISEVEVNYLFWQGSSPLILVILFSVLLGAILAMIAGSKKYFQYKKMTKELQHQIKELKQESTVDLNKHKPVQEKKTKQVQEDINKDQK